MGVVDTFTYCGTNIIHCPHVVPLYIIHCPQVVPVYTGHQLVLKLTVYNDDGLMFDNFTSLKWNWESSSPTHLSIKDVGLSHQGNHGNHFIIMYVMCY